MNWLDDLIETVNSAGDDGEWATQSRTAAWNAVDKLELPTIPDDAVVDLVGCLIDEIERLNSLAIRAWHSFRSGLSFETGCDCGLTDADIEELVRMAAAADDKLRDQQPS